MANGDDVIRDAGNHLRGAMDSAGWLDVFAKLALVAGVLYAVAGFAYATSEEEPIGFVLGVSGLIVGGLGWALLKGFASLVWLQVDKVLVAAIDEDDES